MYLELMECLFSYPGSFGRLSPLCRGYSPQAEIADSSFLCTHNETPSVAAVRVGNPDRSLVGMNRCDPPGRREFPPASGLPGINPLSANRMWRANWMHALNCEDGNPSPFWASCMNHLRAREDEHEDWGEPPPFWFVRSWGDYRTTKFRSFSLVYL